MFSITLKNGFLKPKISILVLTFTSLSNDSFTFIWKKILCHNLSFGSSGLNFEFIHREYGFFDKFENIIHEVGWSTNFNFENLSHKFSQLQILILKLYFYVKIVSSEFSSVEVSIVYFKPVLKFKTLCHCYLLLVILVLCNWILCKVFSKTYKFPTCNLLLGAKVS